MDFKLAEASYYFEKMYPTHYERYSFLTKIRNSIEKLPEVKKYYESANAIKGPFLQSYAKLQFWSSYSYYLSNYRIPYYNKY